MSKFPTPESILLQVHQSLGCKPYQTKKKLSFATLRKPMSDQAQMYIDIFDDIFDSLDMAPDARFEAIEMFKYYAQGYKHLELNTWSFAADERLVLWSLFSSVFIPLISRQVAFWTLDGTLDQGMPGGHFWYLPALKELEGKRHLDLPVAQVVDWLLDILGMPPEEFSSNRGQQSSNTNDEGTEGLARTLYNWRKGTIPNRKKIEEFFADDSNMEFRGVFNVDEKMLPSEQFAAALIFVKQKKLAADRLRLEIPMSKPGRLEAILEGNSDESEQKEFVKMLADRFTAPQPRIIRKRLLLARAIQDGYKRLQKTISPNVDWLCTEPDKNKILQLFDLYKYIYNLTIAARNNCEQPDNEKEDKWFEDHLLDYLALGPLLLICPSINIEGRGFYMLAEFMSRYFLTLQPDSDLDDLFLLELTSVESMARRNLERFQDCAEGQKAQMELIENLKVGSPWRVLQRENCFWVVLQVAKNGLISHRAQKAVIQRMRELALTPVDIMQTIECELHIYLNVENQKTTKETRERINQLIEEAENNPGYALWNAPIMRCKALHLLACNEFKEAEKIYRQAFGLCDSQNYGPLHGEIAKELFSISVANQRLIHESHELYYRHMISNWGVEISCGEKPLGIEEMARRSHEHFWKNMYKPYPGVERLKPRGERESIKMVDSLIPYMKTQDEIGLQKWIKNNSKYICSPIPDVNGDTLLMLLIKAHSSLDNTLNSVYKTENITANDNSSHELERAITFWRKMISDLIELGMDEQLNTSDFKGQTPLMLLAEKGDSQLLKLLLDKGADPDIQDYKGRTALFSAIKSHTDDCVTYLLEHPCDTGKLTVDGRNALHTAAWSGSVFAVERLLELSPELAWKRDAYNYTPLEHIEFLLEDPMAYQSLIFKIKENQMPIPSKIQYDSIISLLESAPLSV